MYKKWRSKKTMDKTTWDAIIIGSGLSGLATAGDFKFEGNESISS